jgi:hypothetical protein
MVVSSPAFYITQEKVTGLPERQGGHILDRGSTFSPIY